PVERLPVLSRELPCASEQVALEIVGLARDDARLVERSHGFAPQVLDLGSGEALPVHRVTNQDLRRRAILEKRRKRALQGIVGAAESVPAAVPRVDRLSGDVPERPALASLHAGLVD